MIHTYRFRGHAIVVDVNSGAIHLVSELVFQLLADSSTVFQLPGDESLAGLEAQYGPEAVAEAIAEIRATLMAFLLFREVPTFWQYVGGAVTIAGIVWYNTFEARAARVETGKPGTR